MDSLEDDDLKLVAYTIVFAKRGRERIMPAGSGSLVETERLSEQEFVGGLIARYITANRDTAEFRSVVKTTADLRFLKVHYVVSARWPRERLNAQERQAEALETIRDAFGRDI